MELLLALPVILLLGLGIVQFALVYQAKHALDHALTQAARQGAVDH
ncbi:MAG TPA: TadE/TadG family type IV pilus assembly protein, partial [Lautropia sp.]|nr:TadE/TadG family type IV pilus assembly protein [Lautropia sp.]